MYYQEPSLVDLEKLESFIPTIAMNETSTKSFANVLTYISSILTNKEILNKITISDVIEHYTDNYKELSEGILITELKNVYEDARELLLQESEINYDYSDEQFEYNGFIKSEFVIHEHDSRKAPLHWDFRFKTEFKTSAYSFVILKHKMPEVTEEKLLCKQQPMHPPVWVDLDHTSIESGYGAGSVKTIDRGTIYYKQKNESFSFYIIGDVYKGAFHLLNVRNSNYLLFKAVDSILSTPEEREAEWIEYAKKFCYYVKTQILKKYNIDLPLQVDKDRILDKNEYTYTILTSDNSTIFLQSLQHCINVKKSGEINTIIHKDCNINSVEDISRLYMLRNFISAMFVNELMDRFGTDIVDEIYDETYEKTYYTDGDLETLRKSDPLYKRLWLQHIFSDIFMGHKFYGQFDFERYLINKVKNAVPVS